MGFGRVWLNGCLDLLVLGGVLGVWWVLGFAFLGNVFSAFGGFGLGVVGLVWVGLCGCGWWGFGYLGFRFWVGNRRFLLLRCVWVVVVRCGVAGVFGVGYGWGR